MGRRALTLCLLLVPAVGLGALGLLMVAAAPARPGAAGVGAPAHYAVRQLVGLGCGAALGAALARLGTRRLFAAAPLVFLAALALTLAVFAPGIGVRAAGARRWVHLGFLSGGPAPFLLGAVALLVAAARDPRARRLAVAGALLAVLALVIEPDFSAAAIALAVAFAALAGGGVAGRRLLPAAGLLLIALAIGATRFGYVENRIRGFRSPESDRRGKGFEVLALAHANAAGASHGVGIGHGSSRHRLSSPASDYAFAVVGEELGRAGRVRRRRRLAGHRRGRRAGGALAGGPPRSVRARGGGRGRHRARSAGRAAHRRLPWVAPDHRRDHAPPQLRSRR